MMCSPAHWPQHHALEAQWQQQHGHGTPHHHHGKDNANQLWPSLTTPTLCYVTHTPNWWWLMLLSISSPLPCHEHTPQPQAWAPSSLPPPFFNTRTSRCHVANSDVATKWRWWMMSFLSMSTYINDTEVEAWSNINLAVMLNIRKKLFTHALYVHHFIPSSGFWPPCPFLVIILVWLAKRPPSFLGLLVKPKIRFKQSLMAELGIQIVSYWPRYIWVFDSYIYFAQISQYIFPFLCLPWMYAKINIVSRSGSWCRHKVLSATPSISRKWGATGKATGVYCNTRKNYWSLLPCMGELL